MSYMNCPRCGLSLGLRAPFLTLDRCPRCLARAGAAIPMYLSERPLGVGEPAQQHRHELRHRPPPVLGSPASPEFSVVSERLGSTHRVAPFGELDLATCPTLEQELIRVEA